MFSPPLLANCNNVLSLLLIKNFSSLAHIRLISFPFIIRKAFEDVFVCWEKRKSDYEQKNFSKSYQEVGGRTTRNNFTLMFNLRDINVLENWEQENVIKRKLQIYHRLTIPLKVNWWNILWKCLIESSFYARICIILMTMIWDITWHFLEKLEMKSQKYLTMFLNAERNLFFKRMH